MEDEENELDEIFEDEADGIPDHPVWRPQLHSSETLHAHHDEVKHEVEEVPAAHESMKLAPKVPKKDDPRINIPQGRATETHDHIIVDKDPVKTIE